MSVTCYHCQDIVPASRIQKDADKQFCCHGCELAFEIMQEHDAAAFYQLRDQQAHSINQQQLNVETDEFTYAYDSDAFKAHYVQELGDEQHAVTWFVKGAHCAACVWLLERLHLFDPGISNSRIHIGKQQLTTYFDPQKTSPAKIAAILARIGYHVYPWHSPLHQAAQIKDQRSLFLRLAVACACMLGCMHLSWNILAGEFTLDLDAGSRDFFALLAALISIPAVTYSAWPWYKSAWQSLKLKHINIDVSISLIIFLGIGASTYHLILGRSDLYFDAICMFVCFLLGGRTLLYLAQQHIGQEQDTLKQLLPLFVQKINPDGDVDICIDDIAIGDQLRVRAGERVPVDARLISNFAMVDNALLNGESLPIEIHQDAKISAGAQILDQEVIIQATSEYQQSHLARLLNKSVHEKECKDLSYYLMQWFTPVISLLGLITWLIWSSLDPTRAWDQAIAVFIVACPCALGIAAPLAHAVFMRAAACYGILIRNAAVLQDLPKAKNIVFDKTGTLTHGILQCKHIQWQCENKDDIVPHLLDACRQSQHPIARCLIGHFAEHADASTSSVNAIKLIPNGIFYESSIGELILRKAQATHDDGFNTSELLLNNNVVALFSFSDQIRESLHPFIQAHKDTISICSGDHQHSVNHIAAQLDIARSVGDQSPEDKQNYINSLPGPQIMIGDGVNDALALRTAAIGVGVRGGLEAAMHNSDVYISNDIEANIPRLWQLSDKHNSCLRTCLGISIIYNLVGIACAMAGLWGPFICAIAMPLSSLTVMAIAWYWPFHDSKQQESLALKRAHEFPQASML